MTVRHPLRGEQVLITGGGGGLGRELALRAAARGAEVTIWDLSEQAGQSVRDEIRGRGGRARSWTVDVTDRESVASAAGETGPVDVVINNAGVVAGQRLLDATEDAIERTLEVNVKALYWVTRAFLGGMIERRHGTVVTISSAAGLTGVARQTDYSASKFAAFGFAESLRAELTKDRTGVNSLVVCPYYIDTGMFEGVRTRFPRLLPILSTDQVAEKTLRALEAGKAQLVMPPFARTAQFRILPPRIYDRMMTFFGVNASMDDFTGRPGSPPPSPPPPPR